MTIRLGHVVAAARRLRSYIPETPLYRSDGLSALLGADVWIKVETVNAVGSFKLRGALNTLLGSDGAPIAVTSSTGNHGIAVARAASMLGLACEVFVPAHALESKVAAIRAQGAKVHVGGHDIDDAKDRARAFAAERRGRFVDDGESEELIAGAGTVGLEIALGLPDVDHVFVPMGSGSLAAGVAIAVTGIQPSATVCTVQSSGAPAMTRSFHAKRPVEAPIDTIGDCIVCRVPATTALHLLLEHVGDAVLVDDRDLLSAVHTALCMAGVLVEPGAAAGLAGAFARRADLRAKRVVLVFTGANIAPAVLAQAVAGPLLGRS
jgi:threonine dehydratase